MKTFKDLKPGDTLYFNGIQSKLNIIELSTSSIKFDVEVPRKSNRVSYPLVEYVEVRLSKEDYESYIHINYNICLSTILIKDVWEIIRLQKKVKEIEEIKEQLTQLKQKLDRICT